MSIWSSLYTATSGITAYGNAMGVVGDNIANVNSIGFKGSRASFAAVLGGIGPHQSRIGAGVFMDGAETGFGQGSLQQTGDNYHVALQGKGYFMVKGSHLGQEGAFYTRDGRFQNLNGVLSTTDGLRVQGFPWDPIQGDFSAVRGDLALDNYLPPEATTQAKLRLQLPNDTGATSPFSRNESFTVYDSLGEAHTVNLVFTSGGLGSNHWDWTAQEAGTGVTLGGGGLDFDTEGNLVAQVGGPLAATFPGAAAMVLDLDFGNSRQSNEAATMIPNVNGHGAETLSSVQVAEDGTITGVYDKGGTRKLGRLAVASFGAESGLEHTGGQLFRETAASGPALVGVAGSGGHGSVLSGVLEGSNVDLGTELVTMITYQRAFQANARAVSAADEMLSETANLKR
jgi:flagellar hook protein FlgE